VQSLTRPVWEALQLAEENGDLETRQRAALLATKIRAANGMLNPINGVEFKLIGSSEWTVPHAAGHTNFGLTWQIKNTTNTAYRFCLRDSLRVELRDSSGKGLTKFTGSDNYHSWESSPPLVKNERYSMAFVVQVFESNRIFKCAFFDEFGACRVASRLSKGRYRFVVNYCNMSEAMDELAPYWLGSVEVGMDVNIK
jgi:hypothetical protein